jgi:hypothetical protein
VIEIENQNFYWQFVPGLLQPNVGFSVELSLQLYFEIACKLGQYGWFNVVLQTNPGK